VRRIRSSLAASLLAAVLLAPGPVRAAEAIDLRSETLTVDHRGRTATFGGGVTATRGALVLACPEVVATYDAGGQVREVRCAGPVEATEGARRMTAARGHFDNATGLLTLEGEPTLVEGERRLEGETLIYDANASTARMTRARGLLPAAEAFLAACAEPSSAQPDEDLLAPVHLVERLGAGLARP